MEARPAGGGKRHRAGLFPAPERHSGKVEADFPIRSCSEKKPERDGDKARSSAALSE
jgi:hypothetical protein